ncbi:MAG: hypothetical protein NTW21_24370 [Verrucomicrobia bacterium]|nr:hypothetical protein [Verrucomicrobiota bacterium]
MDLILTKMMRGNDPQDMDDVAFLARQDGVTPEQMEPAFVAVRMPDVQELRERPLSVPCQWFGISCAAIRADEEASRGPASVVKIHFMPV